MKLCFFSKQNIRLVCEMHEFDSIIQKQNDDWIAQWNDAIDSEKFNVTVANRAHQYGENVLELILIDFQTIVSVCIVFFVVQIGTNTKKNDNMNRQLADWWWYLHCWCENRKWMFEAIDLRKCDFSDTIPQIFFPRVIGITG